MLLFFLIVFLIICGLALTWLISIIKSSETHKKADIVRYPAFDGTEKKSYKHVQNFTVIDFETGNRFPDSICSIGIVVVKDNKISEQQHLYINPPYGEEDFNNTPIHGIKYSEVQNAPTFAELWPSILPYIKHQYVAAYNASFDVGCLEASLKKYNLPSPGYGVIDILQTARYEWPDLKNHKLITVAKALNIPHNPHNALSDASAAANILIIANAQKSHKAKIIYKSLSDNSIDKMEEIFKSGQQLFKKARDIATTITSTNENDYLEVFELLQSAINTKNQPENKNAKLYRFYGEIYEKCNNKDNAINYYQIAMSLDDKVGVKQKLNHLLAKN